jgi:hypothetical protein
MAATGLLGINPYFKGVSLDTSKPVNLAIQLEQKNQAKKEALDKYFMDYEKSINPAGMRSQDQDIVLKKLNENKQFYMQNRDRILNPSKYGAEAQSRYMAGFKDILSDISKSKQASAEDKVLQNTYSRIKTQGLEIPDGFMEAIQESQKPIYAGYKPVDLFKFDFNKPYNETEFTKNVWSGLTLPTKEVPTTLPNGKVQYAKISYLTPDIAQAVALNAINEYKTKPGSTKNFNNLMKDANIFSAAEKEFGEAFKYTDPKTKKIVKPRIESPEQFVAGYALLKKPTGEISRGKEDFDWLTKFRMQQGAIDRRADEKDAGEYSPEVQVDEIFEAGKGDKIQINVEGKNIKGRRVQLPADIEGKFDRKVGNTKFSPDYFVMSEDKLNLYPVFVTGKTKYGSDILGGEGGTKLNEKIPVKTSLIPALGKAYGGQSWTKKNLFSDGTKQTPAKDSKKKGSSGINWSKQK